MSDTIIAIDLGRYKSVACVYSRTSREHVFTTFDTTPAALARFLARHPGGLVVIEACAHAGWVHDPAIAAGDETSDVCPAPRAATNGRPLRWDEPVA